MPHCVFVTGGTGYIGSRLIPMLHKRSYDIRALVRKSGVPASVVRPWYVLGAGHRWPYASMPIYWILAKLPATKESAERLGLVTIDQILSALVWVVENPATETRVIDVPKIRELS